MRRPSQVKMSKHDPIMVQILSEGPHVQQMKARELIEYVPALKENATTWITLTTRNDSENSGVNFERRRRRRGLQREQANKVAHK